MFFFESSMNVFGWGRKLEMIFVEIFVGYDFREEKWFVGLNFIYAHKCFFSLPICKVNK